MPIPQPGESAVVTWTPAGTQPRWLGTIGHVKALTYSWANPGGADQMSLTLQLPAQARTDALNPGRIVQIVRGGAVIWDGKLLEPVPGPDGWAVTAVGTGNQGTDFTAIWTAAWGTNQNDAVNQAITRGLRWTNPGGGTAIPAGVWFGQQVDSGSQTITDLLNLFCTKGGYTWYVATQAQNQNVTYFGNNRLSVYTLPATTLANVTRVLVSATPVARTLGGDINSLFLRYQTAADAAAKVATYSTVNVTTAASITAHQPMEAYEDLSSTGVQTSGSVTTAGNNILNRYQRASFSGGFTIRYGELLMPGGFPVDLGVDHCGQMCRVVLTDFGYGGEIVPDPVIFMIGNYAYDDVAQQASVVPFQSMDMSMANMLSALGTTLTPHPGPKAARKVLGSVQHYRRGGGGKALGTVQKYRR